MELILGILSAFLIIILCALPITGMIILWDEVIQPWVSKWQWSDFEYEDEEPEVTHVHCETDST